ncbi:hypothetical protein ONZ45_g12722 [Pleurotus djamor]|nr:hypothetical protein ONZ45_g12722 [Pleurotus djamor]
MPQLLRTEISAQQAIDQEIAKHETVIVQLRRRRNTFSVVGQIPDDIQSNIFVIYREQRIFKAVPGSWVNILGVCTHWRQLIYDTPRFWAIIAPTYYLGYTHLPSMLKYSKQAPLRVCFPINEFMGTEAEAAFVDDEEYVLERLDRLFPYGPRIKELYLTFHIHHTGFLELFFTMLDDVDSIKLRILRLEGLPTTAATRLKSARCLRSTLPWNAVSSIQTLDLIDVVIPPDIPTLPSLLNLFVHCSALQGLPLSWIVEFLSHTPNIEVIKLSDKIAATLDLESDEAEMVINRHVEKASQSLSFGAFCGQLVVKKPGAVTDDAIWGAKVLCSLLSSTIQLSLVNKVVVVIRHDYYLLSVSQSTPVDDDSILILELRLPSSLLMREYIGICASILPTTEITELTIDDPGDVKANSLLAWSRVLPVLSGLHILNIVNGRPNFAPVILRKSLKIGPSNAAKNSALDLVSIVGSDWTTRDGNKAVTELQRILQKRQQMGAPLLTLRFSQSKVTRAQVELLCHFAQICLDGIDTVE